MAVTKLELKAKYVDVLASLTPDQKWLVEQSKAAVRYGAKHDPLCLHGFQHALDQVMEIEADLVNSAAQAV